MPNHQSDFSWEDTAALAKSGDKRAYHRLLHEITSYCPKVLSAKLSSQDWIDDITQDILISVHKSLYTYEESRAFLPWLNAIIYFRQTDFLRKHYKNRDLKQNALQHVKSFDSDVTKPLYAGELKDIEAALMALPTKHQKIFKMVKIEGYSMKEVSAYTNMSESAVKVTIHRITKKLKAHLTNTQ